MTVNELRTLVDNLDEYIRIPGGIDRLRKTILHLAVSGQLVPQLPADGSSEDLVNRIHAEKLKLLSGNKARKSVDIRPITDSDKPFDIPSSWTWQRLQNVSLVITDGEHSSPNKTNAGIPLVTAKDVRGDGVDLSNTSYVSRIDAEKFWKRCHPEDGDLLICSRGTIGRSTISNAGQEYCLMGSVILVKFTSKQAISSFTKYYLDTIAGQKQIGALTMGTAVNALYLKDIKDAVIPIPPLHEQIRIVDTVKDIFSTIDKLDMEYQSEEKTRNELTIASLTKLAEGNGLAIDRLREIIKTEHDIRQLEKAVLAIAVRGKLVPQKPEEGTGEELYAQIQVEKTRFLTEGKFKKRNDSPKLNDDEIPFQVPQSWKWVRLSDITNFSIGRTPKRAESIYWDDEFFPWASIADLNDQNYVDETKEKISKRAFDEVFKGVFAPAGSLLYSFKLTIGKMSILGVDAVHNEAIASLETHDRITRDYLFKALKILDPTKRTNSAIKGKTLNSTTLALLEVPLPPLGEQKRIVDKIEELFALTSELRSYIG